MRDEDLTQMLSGDLDGAFDDLVRAYQDRLYAFAFRSTASPRDAEEIAQDTFMRAYRALSAYSRDQVTCLRLRPWLFQIAVNVARNRARGRRIRLAPLDDASVSDAARAVVDADPSPETAATRAEQSDELAAHVAALPERYRTPVVLRHVNDLGYAEIATLLAQPVGTVKSNVHRGVALLRQALTDAGAVMEGYDG